MHSCLGDWHAIESTVVYHARAVHEFSAGIKCRHCNSNTLNQMTIHPITTDASALNPLMLKDSFQKLSSGSMILLTITFELGIILQNI